ncbi:hypothetical protein SAMN05519103_04993 [Rhizobiales bacterium GAS113]|jgi:hypothetical protein|nr:hypothetical protein SAMN05519103_04993 [Rhizobiales bacterium GAS113]
MQTRMEGTFSSRHRLIADIVLHPVVQIAVIL